VTWSHPVLESVVECVRERAGLVFPPGRRAAVEESIRGEMERLGVQHPGRYLARLQSDTAARDALVSRLTIGESYFFRDAGQFRVIRERILPELRAGCRDAIRCWSAGCAAGEEPYSLAIMLEEQQVADSFVLGTDIARPRLLQAQRGEYSAWALRGVPPETVARYFVPRGRTFQLKKRILSRVRFDYLNLAEDRYPALGGNAWGMHLILCRNVLIYFDAPTVEQVAARLLRTLTPQGWLVLGASDPVISEFVPCEPVLTDAGLAYRPREARTLVQVPFAAPATPPGAPQPVAPDTTPRRPARRVGNREGVPGGAAPPLDRLAAGLEEARAAYIARAYDRAARSAERAVSAGGNSEAVWVTWIRALANAGRLREAYAVTTRALEQRGPTAELHYLQAVLHLQEERAPEAVDAARRALYLDRGLAVAHLTLADALVRLSRRDAARRSLRNAAEILARMPPSETVPAADGESAGRLAELARVRVQLLDEVA
jgi:chemotaxis protein methyltransferase CheR